MLDIFKLAHSLLNEHDKNSHLLGIATSSVLEKQNRQAKNVYCVLSSLRNYCQITLLVLYVNAIHLG